MSYNKLALGTYAHNPVLSMGNYAVADFKDELTDYNAASNAKLIHSSVRILPTGGLAGVFNGNQQQIDYLLTNVDELCHFKRMAVRLNITNNDATNAAVLLPAQYLVNYFELLLENGQVETPYNHNLFYDNFYLAKNDEEVYNKQNLVASAGGFDGTAYGSSISIPASGSAIVYVELPNLFTKNDIFIKAIAKNIGIRIQFHPSGMTSTSTSSGISLTDADLYIEGIKYEQSISDKLMARYRAIDHVFPYSEPIRAIVPGQALSATNKSNVKITELSGMAINQLAVFIVPAGAADEGQYNFQPITKIDLLRSGRTIGSFQDVNSDWWKLQMSEMFGTTAVRTNNVYVLSFSKCPVLAANHGAQRGSIFMSTNDVLEIQAGTAGNYDVYVLAYRFDTITVFKNGNLSVDQITQ